MAYPVYVRSSDVSGGSGNNTVALFPTGMNVGDLLVMFLIDADNDTFIVPVGWTKIKELSATGASICVMWKRVDGSEPSYIFVDHNSGNSTYSVGVMHLFSGVHGHGLPFEGLNNAGIVSSATASYPSVTTTDNERLVLALLGTTPYANTTTPTSYINCNDQGWLTSTPTFSLKAYRQNVAVAGTTVARTSPLMDSGLNSLVCLWGTISIALLPDTGTIALTANNIESGIEINAPALKQVHGLLSVAVESLSVIVVQSTLKLLWDLVANAVESGNVIIANSGIAQIYDLVSPIIETGNPIVKNSIIGQVHALLSATIETGSPIVGNAAIAQIHALLSATIETDNSTVNNAAIAQIQSLLSSIIEADNVIVNKSSISQIQSLLSAIIETNNSIMENSIIRQVHALLSAVIETGNAIISNSVGGYNFIATIVESENLVISNSIGGYNFIAQIIETAEPIIDDSIIDLLFSSAIESGFPLINDSIIGQIHIIAADIIESRLVISDPVLSKEFSLHLYDLMNGNNNLNNAVDGIYFLILPDNTPTSAKSIVYDFGIIDSIDIIGRNNVIDVYNLLVRVLASDTAEIGQIANYIRAYLDNYYDEHFKDVLLETSGIDPEFETEQFVYNLTYKIHFQN